MTVKLASALPKDDKNGLAAITTDLADRYLSNPGDEFADITPSGTGAGIEDAEIIEEDDTTESGDDE